MSKETKLDINIVINNITNSIEYIESELARMKETLTFLESLKTKGVINHEN